MNPCEANGQEWKCPLTFNMFFSYLSHPSNSKAPLMDAYTYLKKRTYSLITRLSNNWNLTAPIQWLHRWNQRSCIPIFWAYDLFFNLSYFVNSARNMKHQTKQKLWKFTWVVNEVRCHHVETLWNWCEYSFRSRSASSYPPSPPARIHSALWVYMYRDMLKFSNIS